jgi:hypothetical protein
MELPEYNYPLEVAFFTEQRMLAVKIMKSRRELEEFRKYLSKKYAIPLKKVNYYDNS